MTYAEYQTYMLAKHWRAGDADLTANFDTIVKKAEDMINRSLRQFNLSRQVSYTLTDNAYIDLPSDMVEPKAVWLTGYMPACVAVPETYLAKLHNFSASDTGTLFSIYDNKLHILCAPAPLAPLTLNVVYYYKLPTYADDPTSPARDDLPVLYDTAVDVWIHDWLKQKDDKKDAQEQYDAVINSMKLDEAKRKMPSAPMFYNLPGSVA